MTLFTRTEWTAPPVAHGVEPRWSATGDEGGPASRERRRPDPRVVYGSMTMVQLYVPGTRSVAEAEMSSPGPPLATPHSMVDDVPPAIWESTETLRLVSGTLLKLTCSASFRRVKQSALLLTSTVWL